MSTQPKKSEKNKVLKQNPKSSNNKSPKSNKTVSPKIEKAQKFSNK